MEQAPDTSWRFGITAVLMWSTVATAFKLGLSHTSAVQLLWISVLVAWGFFATVMIATGEWRTGLQQPRHRLLTGLALGLFNPTLFYLLLFVAYDRLPAQEAMAINYSWALTLALLAGPILGHRITAGRWLAAGLSYLGVLVIATRGEPLALRFDDAVGVGFALSSTIVWALYWLWTTRLQLPAITSLTLNFSTGAVVTSVLVAMQKASPISTAGLSAGLYVGLVEMGIGFVLWQTAMQRTDNALKTGALIFLAPPLSLILIWLLLDEPPSQSTLFGLGMILAGLALQKVITHKVSAST